MDSTHATPSKLIGLFSALIALAFAAVLGLAGCGSGGDTTQGASDPTPTEASETEGAPIDVTVTITSDVPDHVINQTQTVTLTEGESAYNALEASGADVMGDGSFVTSIDGLANGDAGETSGWTYTVNGEEVMIAASECEVAGGDIVEWTYITSM